MDKDEYLVSLSRYVHLDPVRTRIVEKPEQYKWNSYSGYVIMGKELKWIEYSWILSRFGRDREGAIKCYSGLGNKEIGELFGGIHYSAVSKIYARMGEEIGKDKKIEKPTSDIMSHVKT
ncbi:hypothetical protein M1N42_01345 [Thermodesulfovibrionales bacterium]|nr:hypothetical protein [Thermodesulfovibrionales bacterium]MCL0033429.1 hypothetical protein [Thermodesulfovibrionales bacterium]MCL0035653.1 hypothetical protein [Thermodesulfovibrionales bacterium]MCL0042587.1 hypothetical protein [Thermodesulfovibrionales bacterium]MCL0047332.1 hypothetical protein [Thermodesulfovibrionales bacterium]